MNMQNINTSKILNLLRQKGDNLRRYNSLTINRKIEGSIHLDLNFSRRDYPSFIGLNPDTQEYFLSNNILPNQVTQDIKNVMEKLGYQNGKKSM